MKDEMKTGDDNCHTDNDIICNVKGFRHFMLKGVCISSPVDSFYVLGDAETLTGYTRTLMLPSADRSCWEIRDAFTNALLAHTNHSAEFPIGIRSWYFEAAGGISECEGTSRDLLMHLSVEQPGNFCCGDGVCISSELVCDNNQHCNDRFVTNSQVFLTRIATWLSPCLLLVLTLCLDEVFHPPALVGGI